MSLIGLTIRPDCTTYYWSSCGKIGNHRKIKIIFLSYQKYPRYLDMMYNYSNSNK